MMNLCNATLPTCSGQTLEGVGYGILFLLGFVLNTAALRVFIAKRTDWTDTHIYMLNLNAADFALILFLPFRVYDAFLCLDKTYFCSFLISTHYINMYASILTVTAISVHRYLVIRFPLQSRAWRRKKQVAVALCLSIWVTVVAICAAFNKSNLPDKLRSCYERQRCVPLDMNFLVILEVVGYLVPLLTILFCSTQTIFVLLKEKDESKSAEKINIVGIVAANMVVFIVCYTPLHVGLVMKTPLSPDGQHTFDTIHTYFLVAEWIATSNCGLDSISYHFLLRDFYSK